MIPAHIEHVFKALDRIERRSSSSDGQHGRKSAQSGAQNELSGEDSHAGLGTAEAGLLASQRARIYEFERLIEKLYDVLPENPDRAYDLVRAEYLAIHGPR